MSTGTYRTNSYVQILGEEPELRRGGVGQGDRQLHRVQEQGGQVRAQYLLSLTATSTYGTVPP